MILCMDYKLLTKMQTFRINKYLPRIIGADERGFVNDCYIGSNTLELQYLTDYLR